LANLSNSQNSIVINDVMNKYQIYTGLGSDCIKLDEGIAKIQDEIIAENKKLLAKGGSKAYLNALLVVKSTMENRFVDNDCRSKIESKRLVESGKLLTLQAIKQEENVLKKNEKEQYIYIGLGSLVLLVGLYLIIKKSKKNEKNIIIYFDFRGWWCNSILSFIQEK
jgi:hypothetical protein